MKDKKKIDKEKLRVPFFVTEELSKTLDRFVDVFADQDRMRAVLVPGTNSDTCLFPMDLTRLSTAKVVKYVSTINFFGWSFNGRIRAEDFFMTATGALRLSEDKMELLEEISDDYENEDAHATAKITRDCIFGGVELPLSMQDLVELLEDFSPGRWEAAEQHPALKFDTEQLSQFGSLYMTLLEIEKKNPDKYKRIINRIPYCKFNEKHWKLQAEQNKYLRQVMRFRSSGSPNQNAGLPKISKHTTIQIQRAILQDETLESLMPHERARMITPAKKLSRAELAIVANYHTTAEEDREAFFKCLVDDLGVTWYENDGTGFVRDARNNVQHMFPGSLQGAHPALATSQATTGSTSAAASTSCVSAAASASCVSAADTASSAAAQPSLLTTLAVDPLLKKRKLNGAPSSAVTSVSTMSSPIGPFLSGAVSSTPCTGSISASCLTSSAGFMMSTPSPLPTTSGAISASTLGSSAGSFVASMLSTTCASTLGSSAGSLVASMLSTTCASTLGSSAGSLISTQSVSSTSTSESAQSPEQPKRRKLKRPDDLATPTVPLSRDPITGRPLRKMRWVTPSMAPAPALALVPPAMPLVALAKYYQVLHVFGCYYPNFFCDFFLAVFDENEITSSYGTTLAHLRN